MRLSVFAVALAVSLVIGGVTQDALSGERGTVFLGQPTPDFSVVDAEGKLRGPKKDLGPYRGILLNFWGLRCVTCLEEIPHLNVLSRKYGGKILMLGINVDGIDTEALKSMVRKQRLEVEYPVVADPEFKMVDLFKMEAAPLTVLIDSGGIIRMYHENFSPGDEARLDNALTAMTK